VQEGDKAGEKGSQGDGFRYVINKIVMIGQRTGSFISESRFGWEAGDGRARLRGVGTRFGIGARETGKDWLIYQFFCEEDWSSNT